MRQDHQRAEPDLQRQERGHRQRRPLAPQHPRVETPQHGRDQHDQVAHREPEPEQVGQVAAGDDPQDAGGRQRRADPLPVADARLVERRADQQAGHRPGGADQGRVDRARGLQREVLERVVAGHAQEAEDDEGAPVRADRVVMRPDRSRGEGQQDRECQRPAPERQCQRGKVADERASDDGVAGPEQRRQQQQRCRRRREAGGHAVDGIAGTSAIAPGLSAPGSRMRDPGVNRP